MSPNTTEQESSPNGELSHETLAQALLAAQLEMPSVDKDGENPHFKSKFATLGNLISKARPVINRHGISVAQFPSQDEDGKPTLVTILMHESGDSMQFDAPLFLQKQDPQGQGSAITYMRRYALASALGIADQDDDDGNAGSAGEQPPFGPGAEPILETKFAAAVQAVAGVDAVTPLADKLMQDAGGYLPRVSARAVCLLAAAYVHNNEQKEAATDGGSDAADAAGSDGSGSGAEGSGEPAEGPGAEDE